MKPEKHMHPQPDVLFVADVGVASPVPSIRCYMWRGPDHADTVVRMTQARYSRGTQVIIQREANLDTGSKP